MSAYDDAVLADTPIAYWKCEELTPPTPAPNLLAIDSSGFGHNGTLGPQPADFVQGIAGPILTDSPSYGEAGPVARIPGTGNADSFTPLTTLTWECWSKKTGVGVQTMVNRGANVTTDSYLTWGQVGTGLFVDNVLFGLDWGAGGAFGLISCALDNDTWYHVAGTRSGTTMNLYVNGWLVDSRSDVPGTPIVPDSNQPWRLGYMAHVILGAVNWSQGLSHVAIYDTELTQAQLRTHVVAALGSLPANPCGDTPVISVGCPNAEGTVGEAYSSEVTVVGGTPPYTFAIISGALPDGLTLNPTTGAITGTPTVGGTFNFVVQVTDNDLLTGTSPGCQIVIAAAPPPEEPSPTRTVVFDSDGVGNEWYLALQITDSGDELRDKNLKPFRVTGKGSNRTAKFYAYSPEDDIDVDEIEAGTNASAEQSIPDAATTVKRSARLGLNVPNAMLWTVRVNGTWDGTGERDSVHEISIEQAQQGVRR